MNRIMKLIVNLECLKYLICWFIIGLIVGTIVAVCNVKQVFGELNIPKEPGQDKVLHRYMKPQMRAFIIVYDLDGDGVGDYMTQRQIGQNYTVISHYPMYYGIDFNRDGKLDKATEVFIDTAQDGLNGNEIPLVEWEKMQGSVEG